MLPIRRSAFLSRLSRLEACESFCGRSPAFGWRWPPPPPVCAWANPTEPAMRAAARVETTNDDLAIFAASDALGGNRASCRKFRTRCEQRDAWRAHLFGPGFYLSI